MAYKLFVIVIRHMRRQLRRTILTGLTFAVAILIYTVLSAIPASMDRIAEGASKGLRLIVTAPNAYKLPARYCDPIRKMPHVLGCAAEIIWGATYRDPKDMILAYGTTADLFTVMADSDYHPPPDVLKSMFADRRSVSVGSVLMEEHGWKLGEPITLKNISGKITLTFIPRVEFPPSDYLSRAFFFDRRLLDEAVKNTYGADIADRANFISVRVDRAENMALVADGIDERFRNSDAETETTTESDTVANYVTAIGDLRTIVAGLCIVVLVTVLLIAANSMAMMVRDRIGEVAVMRALGFSRLDVAAVLLVEAMLIGLIGASVGAGLAIVFFGHGFTLGALTGSLGYIAVSWPVAIYAVAIATLVGIASALLPVINAARIPPALAFRKVV
ncbi:MAG TPA: ABC transporter permease [Candidatus Binataceae bacterium]|nr:ABC transporter permease [Candidatus Binataceae bacterium]